MGEPPIRHGAVRGDLRRLLKTRERLPLERVPRVLEFGVTLRVDPIVAFAATTCKPIDLLTFYAFFSGP